MASNHTTLEDGDGDTPDWFELHNPSSEPVNLLNWSASDDSNNPDKWQFPSIDIDPGSYLVIFASGKDRTLSSNDLHTNFQLSADGEYLGLYAPGGSTVIFEYLPQYPFQKPDISFGLQQAIENGLIESTTGRYFTEPTPGFQNSNDWFTGLTSPPTVNVHRGLFDNPFHLVVSSETPGAAIVYTTDGTVPTLENGMQIPPTDSESPTSGTIDVSQTSTFRLSAFRNGQVPSAIITETYLFPENVAFQDRDSVIDAGFPFNWSIVLADYAVDTDIVGPLDLFNGEFADRFVDSLKAIPTLSLVMNSEDLFDQQTGIYTNSESRGSDWERPTSVELIYPDGSNGFQIDAGVRMQGGASRKHFNSTKHSFRLMFRQQYDTPKLTFPLFGEDAADELDQIVLRAGFNDSWATGGSAQYIRDSWARATQLAMEQASSHEMFVHVYINGLYWGLYNAVERPDASFAASYFGGNKSEWDVRNGPDVVDGNNAAWNEMVTLAQEVNTTDEQASNAALQQLLGNASDGSDNPQFETLLDLKNYIDYMILNFYAGTTDWPEKNYYAARHRNSDSTGYKFFAWDSESSLMNHGLNQIDVTQGVALFFAQLRMNKEFRLLFADRVQQHFFNGGSLYVDPVQPEWDPTQIERNVPASRYYELANKVELPLISESARWGDMQQLQPFTLNNWRPERNRLFNDYFRQRSSAVLEQFISANLYPNLAAPTFSQHGGVLSPDFPLSMNAPGDIYFTLDGTDPRQSSFGREVEGATIGPSAILYINPIEINGRTIVKARTLVDGEWSALNKYFFESDMHPLRITEIHYNPSDPTTAERTAMPELDNNDFEFIELLNIGTQAMNLLGTSFTDGISATLPAVNLAPGQRGVIVRDQNAFELRYGTGVNVLGEFTSGGLSNAGENLQLVVNTHDILNFSYGDNDPWPAEADGNGVSLELIDVLDTPADDSGNPARWRASTQFGGTPGAASIASPGVVINEVLTRSDLPVVDAIELHNPTAGDIDIGGWWLSDSDDKFEKFVIPTGTIILAGGYVVFDETDFNMSGNTLHDFSLNGASGDRVWLVVPDDSTGTAAEMLVDYVNFSAALSGESLGRWPGPTERLYPMESVTWGAANSGPRIGPLVISEVMYNPPDPGNGADPGLLEFVEIYNPTPQTVNLSDWEIDGLGFQFPAGSSIGPGQMRVVVPFDPVNDIPAIAHFQQTYHVDIAANSSQYLGPYSGRLDGGGEKLTLLRADNPPMGQPATIPLVIEDQVSYSDQAPWPSTPDDGGDSLHRMATDLWGSSEVSWTAGLPSPGMLGVPVVSQSILEESVVGEVGRVTTVTHLPQQIVLSRTYTNPVVFAQPASFQGNDPVSVRVSDVQPDRFMLQVTEPSDLNGLHGAEETISYAVLEAGSHWLADGTHIEVGTFTTNATVGNIVTFPTWETILFEAPFTSSPVLLSQIQTAAGQPFLNTRHNNILPQTFQLALEQEEVLEEQHGIETVGYLALDSGSGVWNGMLYEARTTSSDFTETFTALDFSQPYAEAPSVLSSLASYHEMDNAHLRYQNLAVNRVEFKVGEDTTRDAEVSHTAESVAYLAIGGQGFLTAVSASSGDGQPQEFAMTVSASGAARDVRVTVDIVHTRTDALTALLESPHGMLVELFSGVGGESENFAETTFDDRGTQPITSGSGPFTGYFQPEGRLADFSGQNITGSWTLHVTDNVAHQDRGALLGWSLLIDRMPKLSGNINHDRRVDSEDIDLLYATLDATDPTFDLDGDGDADRGDVDELVRMFLGTRYGDTDLDQAVDVSDFNFSWSHFDPLGQNRENGWAEGNFDGDGDVDILDIFCVVTNFAPSGISLFSGGESGANLVSNLQPSRSMIDPVETTVSSKLFQSKEEQILPHRIGPKPRGNQILNLSDDRSDSFFSTASRGRETKRVDGVFQESIDWQVGPR